MAILLTIVFTFLILRLCVAGFNYYTTPKLHLATTADSIDKISILIPARNEEKNLRSVLNSILAQQYTNYEVIILDDDSSDSTYNIASEFACAHENFRVIRGEQLPEGWTGKNHACWQLAEQASGDYFLFIDADVWLSPGLLASALSNMRGQRLALLSIFPNQQMRSLGEASVIPLMNYMLLTLLPISLILSHENPVFAAACGQFMMFKAADYKIHQFHHSARGEVTEDLKIMSLVKQTGGRGNSLLANGLLSCRMYMNYRESVMGFSKNFIAPFNDSIPLFLIYLSTVTLGPLLVLSTGNIYLITFFVALVVITRGMTSSLCGEKIGQNTFLHPLQMLNLSIIGLIAIHRGIHKTGKWKGRPLLPNHKYTLGFKRWQNLTEQG